MHKCEGNDSIVKKKKKFSSRSGVRGGGNESFFSPHFSSKISSFLVSVCILYREYLIDSLLNHTTCCMMNPFIFSLTLLTYVHIHPKCQHSFRVIFEFQITRPPLSLSLSFSVFPKLHAFQYIAPGMRACVRWLSRRSPSLSFSPYSLLKKKRTISCCSFFFFTD